MYHWRMLNEIRFSQMCHQKLVLYENFLEHIVFALDGDPSTALQFRIRDSRRHEILDIYDDG